MSLREKSASGPPALGVGSRALVQTACARAGKREAPFRRLGTRGEAACSGTGAETQSVESPGCRHHCPLRTLLLRQWGLTPGPRVALDGAEGPGGGWQSVIGYDLDSLQEREKRKCRQRGGSSSNKPLRGVGVGVALLQKGLQAPQRIWGDGARPSERTRGLVWPEMEGSLWRGSRASLSYTRGEAGAVRAGVGAAGE